MPDPQTGSEVAKKKSCSEDVRDTSTRWPRYYKCSKPAVVTVDGKPWCTIHNPERRKAKREAESAKWKSEADARESARKRIAAAATALGIDATQAYDRKEKWSSATRAEVPIDWLERIAALRSEATQQGDGR